MKLLVIGLGSMGKRRINLLNKYFKNAVQIAAVDTRLDRRNEVEELYAINTYGDLDEAIQMERPDAAIICTAPVSHSQIIIACLQQHLHVFTEINLLSDRYDEIMKEADQMGLHLFLSSTMLYRNEIKYIQKRVKSAQKPLNYRYHVGQYLPDWHPWENYKDFFVGSKATNGCREIFAIELPWIIKTFGTVVGHKVIKDKISLLDLDYPDSFIVVLEHESGFKGVMNVDVVSRKPVRSLEVYSEDMHLFWEGTPSSLSEYDIDAKEMKSIETYDSIEKDSRYSDNIIENAYLEELETFMNKISGKGYVERYTFIEDLYTLQLIDKIEGV